MLDFEYGRRYQLVSDKTKIVPQRPGRKYSILSWMSSQTEEDIIKESDNIANYYAKQERFYNEFNKFNLGYDVVCEDDFYFGRCVQFILDTNNKITWNEIMAKTHDEIIELAHQMKMKILQPKKGDLFHISECDCGWWSYGDNRCECGDVRCSYVDGEVFSLDDIEVGYAEAD